MRATAATPVAIAEQALPVAVGDVVRGARLVAAESLEDERDAPLQLIARQVAQVDAVEQDAALVGVVEAGQQLHQRRLAGAVLAHQRDRLAGRDVQVDAAQRRLGGAGIAEVDVAQLDLGAAHRRQRCLRRVIVARARVEEVDDVGDVQRLAERRGAELHERLERLAHARARRAEDRQVADAEAAVQRPPADVDEGGVDRRRADGDELRAARRSRAGRERQSWPRNSSIRARKRAVSSGARRSSCTSPADVAPVRLLTK